MRLLWSFHEYVLNLRSFDRSLTLGRPPLLGLILLSVSQQRRLTAIGQKKASSPSLVIARDTHNRVREKSSDGTHCDQWDPQRSIFDP
jgi:hypothetical protein